MKTLLIALFMLALSACSLVPTTQPHKPPFRVGGEIASYPNDPNPTIYARMLGDDGCPNANPCTTSTTYGITLLQIWAWNNMLSGTNTQATMFCGPGCFMGPAAGGFINANQLNAAAVPSNAPLLSSNASGQAVSISPTIGGCIGVGANQIYTVCADDASSTFANLPACASGTLGKRFIQTDVVTFPPTRGGAAGGGGTNTSWAVQCTNNAGTYQWTYQ